MSRLLTQLDSNLPLSSSTQGSSLPPSPSKGPDKPDSRMREWTFPRTSSSSSSGSSPMVQSHSTGGISQTPQQLQQQTHGRSSSIAHGGGGSTPIKKTHETNTTRDLRHRSNFSLLQNQPPGTPDLSISLPSTSSSTPTNDSQYTNSTKGVNAGNVGTGAARLVYSNVRRKGLNDLVYFLVFGGAFLLFASSLFGVGYRTTNLPIRNEVELMRTREGVVLRDVEIAKGFRELEDEVPADVYQSKGDTSGDRGREMMSDSPDDESLNDENTHNTYHPPADSALFPHVEHPHELDEHLERLKEGNRPRPARLPVTEINDDDVSEGEEEEYARDGGHDHDGFEDHNLLEESEEDGGDEEEESEIVVDDSISLETGPDLHLSSEEALEASHDSLTALEELLLDADDDEEEDEEARELSAEEEVAQHEAMRHRRPGGGEEGLERLRREREELGRARERWEAALRDGREDAEELEEVEIDGEDGDRVGGELRQKRMKRVRKLR